MESQTRRPKPLQMNRLLKPVSLSLTSYQMNSLTIRSPQLDWSSSISKKTSIQRAGKVRRMEAKRRGISLKCAQLTIVLRCLLTWLWTKVRCRVKKISIYQISVKGWLFQPQLPICLINRNLKPLAQSIAVILKSLRWIKQLLSLRVRRWQMICLTWPPATEKRPILLII